jgi:hypothetical protein
MPFGGSGSEYGGGYGNPGGMAGGEFGGLSGGYGGKGGTAGGAGPQRDTRSFRFFINFVGGDPVIKMIRRGGTGPGEENVFAEKNPFGSTYTETNFKGKPLPPKPKLEITDPVAETPTQVETVSTIADDQRQASRGAITRFGAGTLAALQNPSLQDTGDVVPQGKIGVS